MNTTLALLLLLVALVGFAFAIVALIRKTNRADFDDERASITFNRTWAVASALAAVGTTWLLNLRWLWIVLVWYGWVLAGWYCKWFGVSILGEKLLHRSMGLWDWRNITSDSAIRKELIFSVVWTFISAAMVLWAVLALDNEVHLLQEGVNAEALVTNYRISKTNNGNEYEVQYQFSLDNGASWYTNSWEAVTEPDYDTAIASGKVDILFWPQHPWVNRPLRHAPSTPDTGKLTVIGLVMLASTMVIHGTARKYVSG